MQDHCWFWFRCCICILQPFSFKDGWRDGGRGAVWPCRQRDGWRKGWAEGWCRENKGSPRKTAETERKEKPREAPLQLLCTGGGSPLLVFLCSLHAAARLLIKTTARLQTACINYFTFLIKRGASLSVSEQFCLKLTERKSRKNQTYIPIYNTM